MACVCGALVTHLPDSLCSGRAKDMALTEDVSSLLDVGRIIQRVQAFVQVGESAKITFKDGGTWVGNALISRDSEGDVYVCKGMIFQNDRSVLLDFIGDADGPVGLPIQGANGRIWTDDEESEHGDHTRAAFYADGPGWTRDNAPQIKPFVSDKGAKLAEKASEIEFGWGQMRAKVQTGKGMQWFTAKDLLKAGPETDVWPRKMPLPARPEGQKSTKPRQNKACNGVHKRVRATGERLPVSQIG